MVELASQVHILKGEYNVYINFNDLEFLFSQTINLALFKIDIIVLVSSSYWQQS